MEEELGIWNFIHGTGAGCASIVAWEGSRLLVTGGLAVVIFGVATVVIMHVVHTHRKHVRRELIKLAHEKRQLDTVLKNL